VTLAPPPPRIQLCGPTVIELHGRRLEDRLPGRQGRVLFAYLALNRHRPAGREEVALALWPEGSAAARSGLDPLVSKLRRVLGAEVVEGRSTLRLRLAADATIDVEAAVRSVHRAESHVVQHDWAAAWGPALTAELVAEREFLPGEDLPWVQEERAELAEIRLRALEAYARASLGVGGTEVLAAVRTGRRLVKLAPLRETGYQILMSALAAEGNTAEALSVFAGLAELLREELGAFPSPATRALHRELLEQ
jgi:SARP family transcriptional regulator, regulator of embCAB operon